MSYATVAKWLDDKDDRIRYLNQRVERLCWEAAQSDHVAREHLSRAERAEARIKELEDDNKQRSDRPHVDTERLFLMVRTIQKVTSVLDNMKSISSGQRYQDSVGLQAWFDRRIDEALRHINALTQSSLVAVADGDAPSSSETQPLPDDDSRFTKT